MSVDWAHERGVCGVAACDVRGAATRLWVRSVGYGLTGTGVPVSRRAAQMAAEAWGAGK